MTSYEMRISDWSSDVCSSDLAKLVGYDRHVEHPGHPAAVIIADLALDAALEPVQLRLGGDEVDDAASRVAAIERALRSAQHLQPLHVEEFLLEEAVGDETDIVEADRDARIGRSRNRFGADAADRDVIARKIRFTESKVRHGGEDGGDAVDLRIC